MFAANFVLCFLLRPRRQGSGVVVHRADWSRALVPVAGDPHSPLLLLRSANKLALHSPTAATQCAQRGVKETQAKAGHR